MSARRRAVLAVAGMLLLGSCTPSGTGEVPDPIVTASPTPTPSATSTPTAADGTDPDAGGTDREGAPSTDARALPRGPEVVRWGGRGHQLALVVRNQSDVEVRRAETVIEALDPDGAVLARVHGDRRTTCCTILGLRPGAEYGLFADLGRATVRDVADVRVTYGEARTAVPSAEPPTVTTRLVGLDHTDDDTVVNVDVAVSGASGPYLVGQAFLVGPGDRLVGVVSGRFYCVADGTRRQLRMELQRPTPPSTRVDRVLVHPVPDGVPPGVAHRCR